MALWPNGLMALWQMAYGQWPYWACGSSQRGKSKDYTVFNIIRNMIISILGPVYTETFCGHSRNLVVDAHAFS